MPSSYQQNHQATTPSKRNFNTTETVEHGLSKGTAQFEADANNRSSTTILNNNIHISPSLCSSNTAANKHLSSADCGNHYHQRVEIKMSDTQSNIRDRLGLWGTSDSEVAGNVSGLDRLKNARYNKVNLFIK